VNPAFRILYAEDSAQDADLTRVHFSEHARDFDIEVVVTGQACLDRLARADCDLLLLDHHLPDMEGLAVLRTLVRAEVQVPVVLVTGVGDEDLVVKALRLGAASYVPKLGDYLATLPDLLRRVIEEHRRRQDQGVLPRVSRRILYVEHHSMDIELTLRHFAEVAPEFEIEVVHTCADALARLAQPPAFDVALIDLRMPDQSGLDFAREAQRRRLPLPPFIMISGMGDEAAAIASLKLGAADYVAKRDGYLNQLYYTIDRAIAHDRLDRLTEQLRAELAERNRVEEALRESEKRLRRFYESDLLGVIFWNTRGQITDANDGFLKMVGYTRADLAAGQIDWVGMTPPEYHHLDEDSLVELRTTGRNRAPLEKEYIRKDGTRIPIAVAGAMLDDERVDGVAFVLDITERKRAAADREKLEEQVRMSQRLEAIGSLAGGIAHDFNNLLSVILCCTDFAMAGVREDDRVREELLEVRKAGERAVALTRQILAFSRKQVLQPVVLNVNQVAAGVEKMLRRILGEDIDYVQVLAPDLGMVWADPGQIEQVLMNLVVNARDAMPEGGKLTIETCNVDFDEEYAARHVATKPGPYVRLAVTDTGCGMDAQTQARIFEPFFTTKEKGKGTGLGLSTVYGIVKQSGGNIWVYSEPGQGTTFKIYLPQDFSGSATATGSRLAAVPTLSTGNETILVVEDEKGVRDVAKRILCEAGYEVLTAASPDDALLACKAHPGKIHLLLTDVVMPQMSGRLLAERLALARPGIKVVYMSGYTDDAIVHHGTLDPGTNFVAKPFSAADLTRKILEVLDSEISNPADGHEQSIKADAEMKEPQLDKDALRALPQDVLNRLRQAVIAARHNEIIELLESVRIANATLATELRRMADVFDYDGMRNLLTARS
jgi:PAS domain S-box-containing protein